MDQVRSKLIVLLPSTRRTHSLLLDDASSAPSLTQDWQFGKLEVLRVSPSTSSSDMASRLHMSTKSHRDLFLESVLQNAAASLVRIEIFGTNMGHVRKWPSFPKLKLLRMEAHDASWPLLFPQDLDHIQQMTPNLEQLWLDIIPGLGDFGFAAMNVDGAEYGNAVDQLRTRRPWPIWQNLQVLIGKSREILTFVLSRVGNSLRFLHEIDSSPMSEYAEYQTPTSLLPYEKAYCPGSGFATFQYMKTGTWLHHLALGECADPHPDDVFVPGIGADLTSAAASGSLKTLGVQVAIGEGRGGTRINEELQWLQGMTSVKALSLKLWPGFRVCPERVGAICEVLSSLKHVEELEVSFVPASLLSAIDVVGLIIEAMAKEPGSCLRVVATYIQRAADLDRVRAVVGPGVEVRPRLLDTPEWPVRLSED